VDEEEMLRLVLDADEQAMSTWREILAWLRENNSVSDVLATLEAGRYDEAVSGVEDAAERLAQQWITEFVTAASAAATVVGDSRGGLVTYDATNERARLWSARADSSCVLNSRATRPTWWRASSAVIYAQESTRSTPHGRFVTASA
jgi:hypothetical protein